MRSGNVKLTALFMLDEAQAIRIVVRALTDHGGSITQAAHALGVSRMTMNRWRHKYRAIDVSVDRMLEEMDDS